MNTKKILYVTRIISGVNHIFSKVAAQCEGIENLGYHVDLVFVDDKFNLYYNKKVIAKLHSKIGLQLFFFKKISETIALEGYSIIYIRNPFILNQISYLYFLKLAKKNKCKVILEVPTFPYKRELNDLPSKIIYYNEMLFSIFLKKYVSLILYSGDNYNSIYGISCKQLLNIGNVKIIPISKTSFNGNVLKLIAVSGCMVYHAYERIIEGLNLYYKNSPGLRVEFNIVGTGPDLEKYRNLIVKYRLDNYVIIHGPIYGDTLDTLFSNMNIGISCLGMHRIGLSSGSPLKTAEYAARGLPFVLSYDDLAFSQQDFCYKVPANEEAIDIEALVNWFNNNRFDYNLIRDFTVDNISWEKQYNAIFTRILS